MSASLRHTLIIQIITNILTPFQLIIYISLLLYIEYYKIQKIINKMY